MAKEKGASLNPDNFIEGGGLLDNVDVVWKNPRFETWDYAGKGPSIPALAIDLEPDEGDAITQYWSAGSSDDWNPSKDGTKLVPIGKASSLSKSSNLYQLLKSIKDAGFPEDKMEDDISVYEGMGCHMVRVKAPERPGLKKTEKKYEASVLVVDNIIKLPWGEEKGKGGGKEKGKADVAEIATGVVMEILGDNPKGIAKMKLAQEAFKRLKTQGVDLSTVNAVVSLTGGKDSEEFLASGPWTYEKGIVSQG
jgi:hypothetical protein